METKIDKKRMKKVYHRYGFHFSIEVEADSTKVGLYLAWKTNVTISLRCFSNNFIDVTVHSGGGDNDWRFTSFYESPYVESQNETSDSLRNLRRVI